MRKQSWRREAWVVVNPTVETCVQAITPFGSLSLFFFFSLFLAALGLHCCKQGPLSIVELGLLVAVVSLVADPSLEAGWLSSCTAQA